MRPSSIIISALLIGLAASSIVIEPENPVVRLGQTARMVCKVGGPIKSCLWEIGGDLYNPQESDKYQPYGLLQDGECGIQATITEAENGPWTCRVFGQGGEKAEKATTNVTILALPQISLDRTSDPITVTTGDVTEIKCTIADARPVPAVLWMIGDREIDMSFRQTVVIPKQDGLTTIVDTLRYPFGPADHGQMIRCLTAGSWLNMEDTHDTFAHLNVNFPPQPKDPSTLYGFVAGQPGDIVVNFTANPRPSNVAWLLDDNVRLEVEPFAGRSADQRIEVSELKSTNQSAFEARLRLKSITESDARRVFRLLVESNLNGEPVAQEYIVRISMNAAPLQSNGVSGGGIAAIIIVMIAILVIAAVVLYARNTGRWCFAGTKAVGVSTKERADEEAANVELDETDDVKVESNPRQSLTNRLSSLYETILSKAAPHKKSERFTGVGNTGADVDVKDGAIVYAELDLKASEESSCLRAKEETTEYAEIVPVSAEEAPAKSVDEQEEEKDKEKETEKPSTPT